MELTEETAQSIIGAIEDFFQMRVFFEIFIDHQSQPKQTERCIISLAPTDPITLNADNGSIVVKDTSNSWCILQGDFIMICNGMLIHSMQNGGVRIIMLATDKPIHI